MKKQLEFNIYKGRQGGRRPGSGRMRIHSKGVAHRKRAIVSKRTPLHINFKFKAYIKNKYCLRLLKRAILNSRKKGLAVIHFSLQSNHVHLIVEAIDNHILESGMRSLLVTFSKGLAKGKVQIERYHLHVLKNINETKNAIRYVLFNAQKHGGRKIDEYSSLLAESRAVEWIRAFGMKERMTLVIGKKDDFLELSPSRSFFLMKARESMS